MQSPSPSHTVLYLLMLVATLLGLLPADLGAQQPAPVATAATAIRMDATTLVLATGKHDLKTVVDATAQFLQVNIAVDKAELQMARTTSIELQSPLALDRASAEETISQLTYQCGFVLTPRDVKRGLYELINMQGPRASDAMTSPQTRTPEQILEHPTLKQPVSTAVRLTTINAPMAVNMLRPYFATRGGQGSLTIGTGGDAQTVLLSGLQSEVAQAIDVLRKADTNGAQPAAAVAAAAPANPAAPADLAALQKRIEQLELLVAKLQGQLEALRGAVGRGPAK